jgi:hypothetical protein
MKNRASLLTVIAVILFSVSCSKDDSPGGNQGKNKIKTYTESVKSSILGDYSATFMLNYDQQDRIISMIDAQNSANRFEFSHGQSEFAFDIFSSDTRVIHQDVFLKDNLMDSTFQFNDEGDTTTEKYVYADNLLVKLKRYIYSESGPVLDEVSNYSYDQDKNLISETDGFTTITYEYDGVVVTPVELFPVFFSPSFRLPSRETHSSGGEEVTVDHTYSFDDKQRLISDRAVISTGDEVTKSFTYE